MGILTTATGKQFDIGILATAPDLPYAYIYFKNTDAEMLKKVFGDKNETAVLQTKGTTLAGFTMLDYIRQEDDYLKVRLQKR